MALPEADDLADIFFGGLGGVPVQRVSQGNPCDCCDSCDSQASMRVFGPVHVLRRAAIPCDSSRPAQGAIAGIADSRNGTDAAESQQRRGESQISQESQRLKPAGAATSGDCGATAPKVLALVAWTDDDIARFIDRRGRLMRWGWGEPEAERLAERLVIRDRDQDERVNCTDCRHYRPGRCGNHRPAGLQTAEVGRVLAAILQRCSGFSDTAGPQSR